LVEQARRAGPPAHAPYVNNLAAADDEKQSLVRRRNVRSPASATGERGGAVADGGAGGGTRPGRIGGSRRTAEHLRCARTPRGVYRPPFLQAPKKTPIQVGPVARCGGPLIVHAAAVRQYKNLCGSAARSAEPFCAFAGSDRRPVSARPAPTSHAFPWRPPAARARTDLLFLVRPSAGQRMWVSTNSTTSPRSTTPRRRHRGGPSVVPSVRLSLFYICRKHVPASLFLFMFLSQSPQSPRPRGLPRTAGLSHAHAIPVVSVRLVVL
jgi:hypothetical protein